MPTLSKLEDVIINQTLVIDYLMKQFDVIIQVVKTSKSVNAKKVAEVCTAAIKLKKGKTMKNDPKRKQYAEQCKQAFATWYKSRKVLIRHVRGSDNIPFGVVVAFIGDEQQVRVGCSKCNKLDIYNRHIGLMGAIKDALNSEARVIPTKLRPAVDKMFEFAASEHGQRILKGPIA